MRFVKCRSSVQIVYRIHPTEAAAQHPGIPSSNFSNSILIILEATFVKTHRMFCRLLKQIKTLQGPFEPFLQDHV